MKKMITIPDKNYEAYISYPENKEKLSSIILIHEIWGLNDHIKNVSDRFASEGYAVLAVDLLSSEGFKGIDQNILQEMNIPEKKDEAQKKMRELLAPINSPEFSLKTIEKLKDAYKFLTKESFYNGKIGVLGFCFGGTYSYELAVAESNIAFCIPFYGHAPKDSDIKKIQSPILAFFGENDKNLVDNLPNLEKLMKDNNKSFEYIVYPNTGHAFFNDTNKNMYNKEAAENAWEKTLEFLKLYS
jgi:carboxymethylenebutenolidase